MAFSNERFYSFCDEHGRRVEGHGGRFVEAHADNEICEWKRNLFDGDKRVRYCGERATRDYVFKGVQNER